MKRDPANATKPGPLREGELMLIQTPQARAQMGKGRQTHDRLKALPQPVLNWKHKGENHA